MGSIRDNSVSEFDLWLELEHGEPIDQPANRANENFCNIIVTFKDGRRYALNVWTFDFLQYARYPWPYDIVDSMEPAQYLLPPDLFVEKLERKHIEQIISQLIKNNEMKDEWLCEDDDDEE